MNILFITYWGVDEGLSVATVYPNLKILSDFDDVSKISYITVERKKLDLSKSQYEPLKKVTHIPVQAIRFPTALIGKGLDWIKLISVLHKEIKKIDADIIIARGAMPGILAYFMSLIFKIRYYVESFEPHAEYMAEGKVWSRSGVKYRFEKYFEEKIKKTASGIITVSYRYARHLQESGNIEAQRLYTVPCFIENPKQFEFRELDRAHVRTRLGINKETIVGIYVGKFGGMYYDKVAFDIIEYSMNFFSKNFFLIVLTPQDKNQILTKLQKIGMNENNMFVDLVPHQEVPKYLSAADFAYSFHRPSPSKMALSPIKHGEYWANGLPIIMPDGIGDDSEIIRNEGGGAIFDDISKKAVKIALKNIEAILKDKNHRATIPKLASKYRNIEQQQQVYEAILSRQPVNAKA